MLATTRRLFLGSRIFCGSTGLYGWPYKSATTTTNQRLDVNVAGRFGAFGRQHELTAGLSYSQQKTDTDAQTDPTFDPSNPPPLAAFPYANNIYLEPAWVPAESTQGKQKLTRFHAATRLSLTDGLKGIVDLNAVALTMSLTAGNKRPASHATIGGMTTCHDITARPPTIRSLRKALLLATALLGTLPHPAQAGPIMDRIAERAAERREARQGASSGALTAAQRPAHADMAYGKDPAQTMDVYAPTTAPQGAPVIFMVHGGARAIGDKASSNVVRHKAARWLPKGLLFISVNYRLLPNADPLEQARDVARALAFAQQQAPAWGGDAGKFVLMGHSAGAHLVSLLSAEPALAREQGAKPWLGTVSLDSAAFDVAAIMGARHARLYDRAFGKDPNFWAATSPLHQLRQAQGPLLAVCSSRRDDACPQAQAFAVKATPLGMRVTVLPQDRSHAEINDELGQPGPYTEAVEDFLRSLDPALAKALEARR